MRTSSNNQKKLSDPAARILLLGVWTFCFLLAIFYLMYLYLDNWIESDNFWEAIIQFNAFYAPYIGVFTLFLMGKKSSRVNASISSAFYVALLSSVLWNIIIITICIAPLYFRIGTIEESLNNLKIVGGTLIWIVSPFIGYYFANPVRK